MPAWEYRMLLEQMLEDRPWISYVVHVEMPQDHGTAGSDLGSLAELGMTTRTVG